MAGAVLGIGSPCGLFVLRLQQTFDGSFGAWLRLEILQMWEVYLYAGLATAFFFGAFGYFLGKRNAQLKRRTERLQNMAKHLEKLSTTDGLTKLHLHNYVLERLQEEWLRARRYNASLGCLFIDIDGFKAHNDTYGHLFGDQVLRRIAGVLKLKVRGTDLLGRFGGDEFVVILPETDARRACRVAERIREAVQNLGFFSLNGAVPITVSIGIFASCSLPASANEILYFADSALREAKRLGKNQSQLFEETPEACHANNT